MMLISSPPNQRLIHTVTPTCTLLQLIKYSLQISGPLCPTQRTVTRTHTHTHIAHKICIIYVHVGVCLCVHFRRMCKARSACATKWANMNSFTARHPKTPQLEVPHGGWKIGAGSTRPTEQQWRGGSITFWKLAWKCRHLTGAQIDTRG